MAARPPSSSRALQQRRGAPHRGADGIVESVKIAIHGDNYGYYGAVALLGFSYWLFSWMPLYPILLFGMIFTLCIRVFQACVRGIESGKGVPIYVENQADGFAAGWVYPGLTLVAWHVMLLLALAIPLVAIGEGGSEVWVLLILMGINALLGPALWLVYTNGSISGLVQFPTQLQIIRTAGSSFLIVWALGWFVGWVPMRGLYLFGELSGVLQGVQWALTWVLCAITYAALGGGMGWITRDMRMK